MLRGLWGGCRAEMILIEYLVGESVALCGEFA